MISYDKNIFSRAQGIATDLTVQCKDGDFQAHSVVLLASGLADRVRVAKENVLDLRKRSILVFRKNKKLSKLGCKVQILSFVIT